ncbi:MAG: AI-2E family transporter [Gammaproteobacteria bacterium]|jgi:putative permease
MIRLLLEWYRRHFSDPQAVILALLLITGLLVVVFAGRLLAPLLASIVIAYLLDGAVDKLLRWRVPRMVAVVFVFVLFIVLILAILLGPIPLITQQVAQFFSELPNMVAKGQEQLMLLPERYPHLISEPQVIELINTLRTEITTLGQHVLSVSLSSVVGLITILVYVILVPLLVFFFLKDKYKIMTWVTGFLPEERSLSSRVWAEVNDKIASYVRGKFIEVAFVWVASYIAFMILGMNYAMLLSFLIGLSVIIPYVGATIITFPVALVAYFQWGVNVHFAYAMLAYGIIQFLDGNLLVPLLFSEVVNLHPVAIIVSVIVFGGLWGVWGVFFAIPLATLIQAVLNAWPAPLDQQLDESVE